MECVILAGGLGTRLREVVPDVPKPMARIGSRPFLEIQMDYWIGQGVARFLLSVGYRHRLIMEHFGTTYRTAAIEYVVEAEPLGTGGAVLGCLGRLNSTSPFLIVNGDTYFDVSLTAMKDLHRARAADLTLGLFRAGANDRYLGIRLDDSGQITGLGAGPASGRILMNGGVYLAQRSAFLDVEWPARRLSFESEMLPAMKRSGKRLFGIECDGTFIDIGLPEDYRRAVEVLTR